MTTHEPGPDYRPSRITQRAIALLRARDLEERLNAAAWSVAWFRVGLSPPRSPPNPDQIGTEARLLAEKRARRRALGR